jgi:hypothetical protein
VLRDESETTHLHTTNSTGATGMELEIEQDLPLTLGIESELALLGCTLLFRSAEGQEGATVLDQHTLPGFEL